MSSIELKAETMVRGICEKALAMQDLRYGVVPEGDRTNRVGRILRSIWSDESSVPERDADNSVGRIPTDRWCLRIPSLEGTQDLRKRNCGIPNRQSQFLRPLQGRNHSCDSAVGFHPTLLPRSPSGTCGESSWTRSVGFAELICFRNVPEVLFWPKTILLSGS